jgi:glycoprotein endo-alpha-1,2-mannosidase
VRRLTLVLVLAAFVLPSTAGAGVAPVSIFYYPWYGTPDRDGSYEHWSQEGHIPPSDLATTFYPARGPYSSSNPAVVRAQMREIAAAGISEVIVSWWGWGSPEDLRLPLVMQTAQANQLQVAVEVEPYEKWQRTAGVLSVDLAHLRDLGIERVYVFRPFDGLIDDASWIALNQATGIQVIAQTADVARAAADRFAGVYTYDVLRYGPRAFGTLCAKARALHLLCAPSVAPGYDAFRATGDPRSLPRRIGKTYDAMWKAAIAARPDRITITSYNEWHEGTQIEPAARHAVRALTTSPTASLQYQSYEGAYGLRGKAARRAYLVRTEFWARAFALARDVRRLFAWL